MNAKELFIVAVKLGTQERQDYLAQACGSDAALRQHVLDLIEAQKELGSFLDKPLVQPAPTGAFEGGTAAQPLVGPAAERAGAVIAGRYKLLEQIGEGGMGAVWVAEQTEPVRRKVALKLIKAGMDSKSVLARFEAERQALAVMDHPNIAKVLDGGLTETGRPFFVMEYVKGVPITEYCDTVRLNVRERLALFVQVCSAVQHAHQKGIIHRDLKPSNILVAPYDDKPVPKVIDFGLAKAMHHALTERTLHTAHETVLGTPLYMSPEQAQFNNLDVDTRSDIYSLGVLLYELLTGTTPLEQRRFKEAAWDEVRRLIREEDPPRPSARLSSTHTLPSLAACRQTEPARLTKLVRGELDWIVMKALEKDRNRRYETANGFAADLERYLVGEAVLAAPPSATYRLRKLARRHRRGVMTVAAVATGLLVGTAVATWQAIRASRAETAAVTALTETEQARQDEARAKEIAEGRAAETEAVLSFVQDKIFAAARPEGQGGGLGRNVKMREAIEAAVPFVESSFADRPLIEARLRRSLGQSFDYLSDYQTAERQLQTAYALYLKNRGADHPDTLRCQHDLAINYGEAGRFNDAIKLFEEVLAKRRARGALEEIDTLGNMLNLAAEYVHMNRHADAICLYNEALPILKAKFPQHAFTSGGMEGLANCFAESGQLSKAVELHEEVLRRRVSALGPNHLDTALSRHNLAAAYADAGRLAEARELLLQALALQKEKLGADHYQTLATIQELARVSYLMGQTDEALQLLDDLAVRESGKLGADHPITLATLHGQSCIYEALGKHDQALKLRQQVLEARKRKLGPDHHATIATMALVAESLLNLNRGSEALPLLDQTIRDMRRTGFDQRQLVNTLNLRLDHFEKAQDAAGCRQTAEMLEECNLSDASRLLKAAVFRAVTASVCQNDPRIASADKVQAVQQEADRAMAWLKKAVAAGWRDAKQLKNDNDLQILRDRGDFQKLLAELEAAGPSSKP